MEITVKIPDGLPDGEVARLSNLLEMMSKQRVKRYYDSVEDKDALAKSKTVIANNVIYDAIVADKRIAEAVESI